MHHTQENIIFYSTYTIFDKELLPKCIDSHTKEYKLYDKLLDKISLETELSVSESSEKDGLSPVPILHTLIPPIQNNSPTCSSSPFLSYKSLSSLPTPRSKKPIIEIEDNDNVDSDVKIQLLSSKQSLQPALKTLQEDSELRRSKHQTQILFREENIYRE